MRLPLVASVDSRAANKPMPAAGQKLLPVLKSKICSVRSGSVKHNPSWHIAGSDNPLQSKLVWETFIA